MRANQAAFPVRILCRLLGVSPSGYYAWRGRGPSARAVANAALLERIRTIHRDSREAYGAPMIHAELTEGGEGINHKRVARLMRAHGIVGVTRRKPHWTTRRDPRAVAAPDLVERTYKRDQRQWRERPNPYPSTKPGELQYSPARGTNALLTVSRAPERVADATRTRDFMTRVGRNVVERDSVPMRRM